MERRDFVIKSGITLTVSAFLDLFPGWDAGNSKLSPLDKNDERYKKRPDPNRFAQPVMKAIAVGINAPSPHNTQSWKFRIINDETMLFYVDRDMLLPATDKKIHR
jgi:hypothetical protein